MNASASRRRPVGASAMILRMPKTTAPAEQWGPRLYAYLESHWRALGTNANAWADKHPGIQGASVSRWKTGTEPSLHAFRAVAEALGVPLVEVLSAAGVIREGAVEVTIPAVPSIDLAIDADPTLSPRLRETLRQLVAAFRDVEGGSATDVRVTGVRSKRK